MEKEEKKNGKAYERVIDYVKEELSGGHVKIGERLPPERELADKLNLSRTSVREALRTLENIGIITSTQGAGNTISCNFEKSFGAALSMLFMLRQIDTRQINELRYALEETAIILAVERIEAEEVEAQEIILEKMENETEETERSAYDKKLHDKIAAASQNHLIIAILEVLSGVVEKFIAELRQGIFHGIQGEAELKEAHRMMVSSLRLRDKKAARSAVEKHFRLIEQQLSWEKDMIKNSQV